MVRRRLSLPFTDVKEDDEVVADEEINKSIMIAVNSEDFYYSCYSNLSPCFSGLGYCRNSNLLVLLIMRILFKTVAGADFE